MQTLCKMCHVWPINRNKYEIDAELIISNNVILSSSLAMCGGGWYNTNPRQSRMQLVNWLVDSHLLCYQYTNAIVSLCGGRVIELRPLLYCTAHTHTRTHIRRQINPSQMVMATAVNRYKSQASHHQHPHQFGDAMFRLRLSYFVMTSFAHVCKNLLKRNMHTHSRDY